LIQLNKLVASVINVPAEELTSSSGPENLSTWDSLAHIGIIAAIEQTYRVQFSMPEMLAIKSIGDLRNLLRKHGVSLMDDGRSG
jgi:acyl carrier protein